MNQNKVLSVRNLVLIAMFSALAAVLETIQVAVPFAPPFYKLDFAELPVLIGGFAMGPAQAALIAIVKNLLKLLLNGTSTYYVGELGNIIGSCMFSVPAALIYRRHKTKKTAMVALAAGVICAIVGAVFVNCAITLPFYAKVAFGGIDDRSGHDIRLADLLNNFIHGTAFSQLLGKIIRVIIQVVADDRRRDLTRECFLQAS